MIRFSACVWLQTYDALLHFAHSFVCSIYSVVRRSRMVKLKLCPLISEPVNRNSHERPRLKRDTQPERERESKRKNSTSTQIISLPGSEWMVCHSKPQHLFAPHRNFSKLSLEFWDDWIRRELFRKNWRSAMCTGYWIRDSRDLSCLSDSVWCVCFCVYCVHHFYCSILLSNIFHGTETMLFQLRLFIRQINQQQQKCTEQILLDNKHCLNHCYLIRGNWIELALKSCVWLCLSGQLDDVVNLPRKTHNSNQFWWS